MHLKDIVCLSQGIPEVKYYIKEFMHFEEAQNAQYYEPERN
jgi:hypothetical protein